jgi:hypothetical protein
MSYNIKQVKNICDENTGFKLQMVYNNAKTRTFEFVPNPTNLNDLHVRDRDFGCGLFLKGTTFQMKFDYTYKTIKETKQLLIASIQFVKEKIKSLVISNEHDYVIENEYAHINSLTKVLNVINNEQNSFSSDDDRMLYSV